jgi:hypothetical protein
MLIREQGKDEGLQYQQESLGQKIQLLPLGLLLDWGWKSSFDPYISPSPCAANDHGWRRNVLKMMWPEANNFWIKPCLHSN